MITGFEIFNKKTVNCRIKKKTSKRYTLFEFRQQVVASSTLTTRRLDPSTFTERLMNLFVEIHTRIIDGSIKCLIRQGGIRPLLALLQSLLRTLYKGEVPQFVNEKTEGIEYLLQFAIVIDRTSSSFVGALLDNSDCVTDPDNCPSLLLSSCIRLHLPQIGRCVVSCLNRKHISVKAEATEGAFNLLKAATYFRSPNMKAETLDFFNDLLSLNNFNVNAKVYGGLTIASVIFSPLKSASTSERTVLLPSILNILVAIGKLPSTSKETITECLMKLSSLERFQNELDLSQLHTERDIISEKRHMDEMVVKFELYRTAHVDNHANSIVNDIGQLSKYKSAIISLIHNTHLDINATEVSGVSSKKKTNMTFSHYAARKKLPLQLFIEHPDFDAMILDSEGDTVLHTFVVEACAGKQDLSSNCMYELELLLNHKNTDVSKLNRKGETVADYCIMQYVDEQIPENAFIKLMKGLNTHEKATNAQIQKSLSVLVRRSLRNSDKLQRLMFSSEKSIESYLCCIQEICNSGHFDINTKDVDGATVAHVAAQAGNELATEIFLKTEGYDPNVRDGNGNTTLFYILETFTVGRVSSFVNPYSWDLTLKNNLNETVYEYCESLTDSNRRGRLLRLLSQIMPGYARHSRKPTPLHRSICNHCVDLL